MKLITQEDLNELLKETEGPCISLDPRIPIILTMRRIVFVLKIFCTNLRPPL